jgi:hypothetical protein
MNTLRCVGALAGTALVLAGCGSSSSGARGSASSASHTPATAIYRAPLSGAAEAASGAAQGRGDAIIAFHGDSLICWRFAHLHGFSGATGAAIHSGVKGRSGQVAIALSTGPRLRHQGCVRLSPTVSKAIISDPSGYYVSITSAQYPAGAVRAQL